MSLDFYLNWTPPEPQPERVFSTNYTHNVTPMWREAGVYEALYKSEGKKAAEIITALERGIADMEARPEVYRVMNPENGWGSYDTALIWLRKVLAACRVHPDTVVGVCS